LVCETFEGRNVTEKRRLVNDNCPSPHHFLELRILKDLDRRLAEVDDDSKEVSGKFKDNFAELRILKNLGAGAKLKNEGGKCRGTGKQAAANFGRKKSGRGWHSRYTMENSTPGINLLSEKQ